MLIVDIIEFCPIPKRLEDIKFAEKYLNSTLSVKQIGEELGLSTSTVLKKLHRRKVRGGNKSKDPKNYRLPNPPWGYKVKDRQLLPNHREMKIARLINKFRGEKKTWRQVAELLNGKKYRTRRDALWTEDKVRKVRKIWKDKI